MSTIAVPPCPEVLLAARFLEETLERLLQARSEIRRVSHPILDESIKHTTYLAIRHAEGVVALARADLVLYPAALTLARSVFEAAVRVIWLAQPILLKDRLSRYLGVVADQVKDHKRLLARAEAFPEALPEIRAELASLLDWQKGLLQECPTPLNTVPHFDKLLAAINRPDLYGNYIVLSQFSHCGQAAADVFGRIRDDGTVGDQVRLLDWYHALVFPCLALQDAGIQTLRLYGISRTRFLPKDFRESLRKAFAALNSPASIAGGV